MLLESDFVVWDTQLGLEDRGAVGESLANLGELSKNGVKILPRMIVTPPAFLQFQKDNNLNLQIKHLLGSINHERHDSLTQVSAYIEKIITHSEIHKDIYTPLFKHLERFLDTRLTVEAYYFQDKKLIGSNAWHDISGENVVIETIRIAWAHLFSASFLQRHTIHHKNHHTFSVCISIAPVFNFELSGSVKTYGKSKSEYEIEAHSMVRFVYNKHNKRIERGDVLPGGDKSALSPADVKILLSYAKASEDAFYLPHVLFWGKKGEDFLVTKIIPSSEAPQYKDTYNSLIQTVTVHPGITIGRLHVIDEKNKSELIASDEIVMLKNIDKDMVETIKKAKGVIVEEDPHPEIVQLIKSLGIPTLVRKNSRLLYSTGDVVSLNATTGEIKRGSMLVS